MRTFKVIQTLRPLFAGALLAGAAVAAQAHVGVSVGVNVGVPVYGPPPPVYYGPPVVYAPAYGTVATALPSGAVSVTIGGGRYWRYGGVWYRPYGPRWVVVAPPPTVVQTVVAEAPQPQAPSRPDPIIYPRNGQSAEQMEADRQACNRWAVTQPAAMADASVFQRSIEACMDARGYTMK